MCAVLQVALDIMQISRMLPIARDAVEGGADWIEAGTPLIKSGGADAIRLLRKEFPDRKIVADMKTMDVGAFEVEIASKAGADIVTVMGLADDSTISEAVAAGRKYGTEIMIDMINVPDKVKRSEEVSELGVSYICLHMGIDTQMRGEAPPLKILEEVVKNVEIPVAVAGGITAETAGDYVKSGASVIIVGGGILKSKDIVSSAAAVKKSMEGIEVETALAKKYTEDELFEAFSRVSTCNISDAYHKKGIILGLTPYIKDGEKMVGRALTVQTANGDWAKPVEAIDRASPGDVIVIDVGGGWMAVWGELAATSAMVAGCAGVVIDGNIRDIDDIRKMGFPAFARNAVPCAGEPKGYGGIGIEISVGGQWVRTGDWIIGDESGLIVVPKEDAVEIANRALDIHENENRTREEIQKGSSLSKVNEISKWEPVK
ncbi:MAG: 3-hexulose-6-phosphate synthase [Candidatus Methanomethylophilaceae archaeon]